jgi:exopolysaccharide biosynthesis polyprenyl glycosylphosphotransferase
MIKRNWRTLLVLLAVSADVIAIILSAVAAYTIRSFFPNLPPLSTYLSIQFEVVFGFLMIFSAMMLGVYRATSHSNSIRQYYLAGKAYLYTILCLFSFLYLFQYNSIPRTFTILFFLILPFVFIFGRVLFNHFVQEMQSRGYGVHNVILAGYDNGGMNIIHKFKKFPELGYNIKGIVTNIKKDPLTPANIHGILVPKYSLSDFKSAVLANNIDRAFVPSTHTITNGYREVLSLCRKHNVKLKVLSEDSDQLLHLSRVYDIAGITLFAPERKNIDLMKRLLKRLFDILFASLSLLVISPILFTASLAIFIETGRPIFFRQKRAAIKGGKKFHFYKFRSMIQDADAVKESLFEKNESDGALFKIKNDPRMTRVGKLIRKFSIDELPQLLNVLKGEMSIVGPRPLPVSDLEKVEGTKEFWRSIKDREKLKPGITGLWQVSGRSKLGFSEMIWLDLYYIENQSLLFDLEIIFATIPVVLFGKGAY